MAHHYANQMGCYLGGKMTDQELVGLISRIIEEHQKEYQVNGAQILLGSLSSALKEKLAEEAAAEKAKVSARFQAALNRARTLFEELQRHD